MAGRPRKNNTDKMKNLDEQISKLQEKIDSINKQKSEQVSKVKEKIDVLLKQKEELISKQKEEEIGELYDVLKQKGISIDELKSIIENNISK